MSVLVLDAEWRPLRVDTWQNAFCDVFVGKAEVVHYSKDKTITGVSRTYPMPSVIRFIRKFKKTRTKIRFTRLNVYSRDHFTCQYCGKRMATEELTFDHVVPRCRGGKTEWENIVASCMACNNRKANRLPQEAGMKLLSRPKRPTYVPSVSVRMENVPEEWKGYWSGQLEG